jgi:histidinol-phosphate aminotransferase
MGYFRENIEKLAGYKPGFQPSGENVVKLNTNENPYPPSPAVLEALAGIGAEQLRRYPDPAGSAFRQAAAELNGVGPECVMCCNGGDEALSIAFRAFCDGGRAVAYPVPTYSLYRVLAGLQGCEAVEEPFDAEFNLPPRLAAAGAAMVIVCNPNAPSGTFVSVEEIASLADEIPGILLVDEAYVDFAGRNCSPLIGEFDNVIILRSMSKGYSLAGLRFGYMIAAPGIIEGLSKVKDSYNVDAVALALATAAIGDRRHFAGNVAKVKRSRGELSRRLEELKFKVTPSSANFILAEPKDFPARGLYDALAGRSIYVRYFDEDGLDDKLRITVGTDRQNAALVAALKEIMRR